MRVVHVGMTFVKCTRFLDVPRARIERFGLVGDREFVLLGANGELLGPEKHFPFLPLEFQFSSKDDSLTLVYPDGRSCSSTLAYAEQSEVVDYLGMRDIRLRKVLGNWDSLLSDRAGFTVRLYRCAEQGAGIDVKAITLVTTGSLRHLAEGLGAEVDHRRFRPNLVIEANGPHIEDSWDGAELMVGTARLRVRSSVPRCVVTQLDAESGDNNLGVVRALQRYRDRVHLPDGLMPQYATPGFASYAEVVSPGDVAVGDAVVVHRPPR